MVETKERFIKNMLTSLLKERFGGGGGGWGDGAEPAHKVQQLCKKELLKRTHRAVTLTDKCSSFRP